MHLESQIHGISQPLSHAEPVHIEDPNCMVPIMKFSTLNYGFNMISKGVFNMNGGRDSWNFKLT